MARLVAVAVWLSVLCALLRQATAVYLPGVNPVDFAKGADVEMKVRQLTSNHDVAHAYYDLDFCQPEGGPVEASENLGEYLEGTTFENSPYKLKMLENSTCNVLCSKKYADVEKWSYMIDENYRIHWVIDNLPGAHGKPGHAAYHDGFPVGGHLLDDNNNIDTNSRYLLNHHHINVQYHATSQGNRIVGFYVLPVSIVHSYTGEFEDPVLTNCPEEGIEESSSPVLISGPNAPKGDTKDVIWTYDIVWTENAEVSWASRWDVYLSMDDAFSDDIHWFAIANSFIISLFLTGMVAMILVRALYKDLSRYNRVATDEEKAEDQEETGWKLVHADVFRAPARHPQAFAVVIGVATQVLLMAIITIVFASIGFLSPANRGALMIALVMLFLTLGCVAGYTAARTYKSFKGKKWQRTTIYTAVGFPGFCFIMMFVMNLFLWGDASSQAIPFGSMFVVLALWFLLSIPLVFVGAFYGFRKEAYKYPVSVGSVPRPVPQQVWYLKNPFVMLVGGVLPFGSVFVEIFFILSSLWMGYYYYVFGFLLLTFVILVITCAEIAIVLIYFQLCAEDYHWWWRSFFVPGAAGAYLFAYSIIYYLRNLDMSFVAGLLYFGYMLLISMFFTLICGAAGHYACFWFTRKIYAAVKVD